MAKAIPESWSEAVSLNATPELGSPEADRVLFVAEDVLRASGIAPSPASWLAAHEDETIGIPDSRLAGFGMHQIKRLVNDHPGSQAGRFMTWAEREVIGPYEKKMKG